MGRHRAKQQELDHTKAGQTLASNLYPLREKSQQAEGEQDFDPVRLRHREGTFQDVFTNVQALVLLCLQERQVFILIVQEEDRRLDRGDGAR